jgi:hypothetical protein
MKTLICDFIDAQGVLLPVMAGKSSFIIEYALNKLYDNVKINYRTIFV